MLVGAQENVGLDTINDAEAGLLGLPQAECPVAHYFGPGIYIREVSIKAGTFAIGHFQLHKHLNIMLRGKVAVLRDDRVVVLEAPLIYVGAPGRKVGLVLEDMVWQNVYANPTDEQDIDKLEATFLDKSEGWSAHEQHMGRLRKALRQRDRDDFYALIAAAGFTAEQVRAQSEDIADRTDIPTPGLTVRDSDIEGKGVYLTYPAGPGDVLAPARIGGKRTLAGRYTNHSIAPNAMFTMTDNGDIQLVATRAIKGCVGGDQGEEVTVDYRQALALSGIEAVR